MVHKKLDGEEVLKELLEKKNPDEVEDLWMNLRLDWVKTWDQNCQTAVLLSRLQHIGQFQCPNNTTMGI